MLKNKKGFTLIELLVVIAIIGLLSTLAVVSLNNARQKSRDAKRVADIKSIQTALELRYVDTENYPTVASTLLIGNDGSDGNAIDSSNGAAGDGFVTTCGSGETCYMGNVPEDPSGSSTGCTSSSSATCAYAYTSTSSTGSACTSGTDCQGYQIWFYLEGATGDLSAGANCATETGISSSCLH